MGVMAVAKCNVEGNAIHSEWLLRGSSGQIRRLWIWIVQSIQIVLTQREKAVPEPKIDFSSIG